MTAHAFIASHDYHDKTYRFDVAFVTVIDENISIEYIDNALTNNSITRSIVTKYHELIKRVFTSFILGAAFWLLFIYLPPLYFSLVLFGILVQIIIFEWKNLFNIYSPLFWLTLPIYPIYHLP